MGEKHRAAEGRVELQKRNAQTYLSQRSQQVATQRREQTERQLGVEESLLGTDDQVAGNLGGVSQEMLPFMGRFQFDQTAAGLKNNAWKNKTLGETAGFQGRVDSANALMQQAQDAAAAGDFTLAEQLKQQAQTGLTANTEQFGELAGIDMSSVFSLVEDPAVAARARLGGPQAQIVGKQLQEARQFQDFDSVASINERRLLSESGERSIAAGSRDAARQNRMGAMSAGASQSAYGRQLGDQRSSREFGAQRAQLFAGVAEGFQQMQRAYAKDTVGFAREWLQGNSGVRESFQGALDQLKTTFSNISLQVASMNQDMAQFQFQRKDAEKARSDARSQYYRDLAVGLGTAMLGAGMSAMGVPGGKQVAAAGQRKPVGGGNGGAMGGQQSGGFDLASLFKMAGG
jgi:hypothetical protein